MDRLVQTTLLTCCPILWPVQECHVVSNVCSTKMTICISTGGLSRSWCQNLGFQRASSLQRSHFLVASLQKNVNVQKPEGKHFPTDPPSKNKLDCLSSKTAEIRWSWFLEVRNDQGIFEKEINVEQSGYSSG